MDEVTAKRLAANEHYFRLRNDMLVGDLVDELERCDDALVVVCECARRECADDVDVTLAEYERVRDRPEHFILVPGHELLEIEDVVERHERYVVVRKSVGRSRPLRAAASRARPRGGGGR